MQNNIVLILRVFFKIHLYMLKKITGIKLWVPCLLLFRVIEIYIPITICKMFEYIFACVTKVAIIELTEKLFDRL